jgi:hypothetical protein
MWQQRAGRGLSLFEGDPSDQGNRTWEIFNHILDDTHRDDYVSKDFFNVQQTAGGLPEGYDFDRFLTNVLGHVRAELESSNFADEIDDQTFRTAAVTFDDNIRRHISFLNGVVHQGAPGEVHLALWNLILSSRSDDNSVYACYRDYLVDE